MKFSLRLKFFLGFLLITVTSFSVLALKGADLSASRTRAAKVRELYGDANYLAASYKVNNSISTTQLETMAFASDTEIWILNVDGTLESHSGTVNAPERVPGFRPVAGAAGNYMTGTFYDCFSEEMLSVYTPLTLNILPEGYVVLHYPISQIQKTADEKLMLAYFLFALMTALLLAALVLLEFVVMQPVKKLQRAAKEYAEKNLTYPSDVKTHDELQTLSLSMEEMARQLSNSGDDQHRFLANISHDFRSPLTSIKGYLTAIQDGTIPPELQGKYINVVINETERLTKLANGLLDMTQLENGILLERTDFDINDLIRSILPTFEGRLEEKDLFFDVTFEEQHRYVNADRSRIQQVIYNLLDNAIKFSGTGSSVDIRTNLHGESVFVSITDHGVGIEKENIGKIWERFYKTDASRGKDRKGTGLGLSIVREIIQAHKEHIDVISTPNVGTEFIFTLPLADE